MKHLSLIALVVGAWLAAGLGGAGFMNAYWRGRYPNSGEGVLECRREIASNVAYGAVAFLGSVVFSGFGYYGWTLACDAAMKKESAE